MGLSYKVDALPQELRAGEFAVVNGSTFVGDENNVPVPVNLNYDLSVVEDYTSWLSSPQVKKTTTLKGSADEIFLVNNGYNTKTQVVHFSGIHNRVYFVYKVTYTAMRVGYYDYDTDSFNIVDPVVSNTAAGNITLDSFDTHGYINIEIADDGHIIIGACGDDDNPRIYRSNTPEDISGFSLQEDSMESYANYFTLTKTKSAIVGRSNSNQQQGMVYHSLDNGITWEPAVEFLKLYDDPNHPYGHWVYGPTAPDHNGDGVFLYIAVLDDVPPATNTNKNYCNWGIVYTKDFQNFCNIEYWASNGASGYSKNVVQNGHITDDEFTANYVVVEGGYNTNKNNIILGIDLLPNGGLVVLSNVGTRTNDGAENYISVTTGYRTSIFNPQTKTWTHNIHTKPANIDDAFNPIKILPRSLDGKVFDILIRVSRNTADSKWEQWRTTDSGDTFTYLKDVGTNPLGDIGNMANAHNAVNKQAYYGLLVNDGEINLIMYDKSVRP